MTLPAHLEQLDGIRKQGAGWIARCPVHDDHNPSLSLTVTDDGKVLAHCHAGCDQDALIDALGLRVETSRIDDSDWTPRGPAIAIYRYEDEEGRHLFDVCRTADKQFPQRRPDPTTKSGWRWSLGDIRRVPYRLPELREAIAQGRSVCITEGEKDAETLRANGRVATCNPGGAGKWRPEYAAHFIDADVTIFADKDAPGQAHARAVAASLEGVAARVWIVEAADPHKDVTAQIEAGIPLSQVTVTHRPDEHVQPDLAPDVHELLEMELPDFDWVVPELLERTDRFMLTGFEGIGKSYWLRQFSIMAAAGVHPGTFEHFDPVRVLVVDCENSLRQNRRAYGPLVAQAAKVGRPVPRGQLRIVQRPGGIDLLDSDDRAWLKERAIAHEPDVLILSPVYRMHTDSPNDETTIRKISDAIDDARFAARCAVMLEHHAGHTQERAGKRALRPVGSSFWMRWLEYGYGIRPSDVQGQDPARPSYVDFKRWRGDRTAVNWPGRLHFGDGWPWEPVPETTGLRAIR